MSNEQALTRLLESSFAISQRRTQALVNSDLSLLEELTAAEQAFTAELLAMSNSSEGIDAASPQERQSLTQLAKKIRQANRKNLALVNNGMDLTRTVLDAICPPVTYQPEGRTSAPISRIPTESRISLKG